MDEQLAETLLKDPMQHTLFRAASICQSAESKGWKISVTRMANIVNIICFKDKKQIGFTFNDTHVVQTSSNGYGQNTEESNKDATEILNSAFDTGDIFYQTESENLIFNDMKIGNNIKQQ